jgi:hypothetical protein
MRPAPINAIPIMILLSICEIPDVIQVVGAPLHRRNAETL